MSVKLKSIIILISVFQIGLLQAGVITIPFEPAAAHRAFLAHALAALDKDVKLVVLLEQLDLDRLARLDPRALEQVLLELRQAAFRRLDSGVVFRQLRVPDADWLRRG